MSQILIYDAHLIEPPLGPGQKVWHTDGMILIASDHAGVCLKAELQKALPSVKWMDLGPELGPDGKAPRVDYPDFAEKLALKISRGEAKQGILICGSGIGMSIAANKVPGIRAALVENPSAARLSREHNDANVLCLGARFLAGEYAAEIVDVWLKTPFSNEPRHAGRVAKLNQLDKYPR